MLLSRSATDRVHRMCSRSLFYRTNSCSHCFTYPLTYCNAHCCTHILAISFANIRYRCPYRHSYAFSDTISAVDSYVGIQR